MLEASDILVAFGDRRVLVNASITLTVGERKALLGASGSGKTTLLRVLAGLHHPEQGRISLDGRSYWHGPVAERPPAIWPRVTLVFQDSRLFPNLTGRENCLLGIASDQAEKRLAALSSDLGTERCLDRRPARLSQGEKQRIAIIRALLRNPSYLLLDEPTSALDPEFRDRLGALLANDVLSSTTGILFVTHDWKFTSDFATSVNFIRDGKCGGPDTESKFFERIAHRPFARRSE